MYERIDAVRTFLLQYQKKKKKKKKRCKRIYYEHMHMYIMARFLSHSIYLSVCQTVDRSNYLSVLNVNVSLCDKMADVINSPACALIPPSYPIFYTYA